MPWIGVDFDQTLRHTNGEPIQPMVDRVKRWIEDGREVRIITARLAPMDHELDDMIRAQCAIRDWCVDHIGHVLAVQWGKSSGMIEFWDDKAVTVEPDTGRRLSYSKVEECS